MTYTFTPDQAAALADVPPDVTAYLAVTGECNGHCGPRRDCCEAPLDPPADLAALVEQRCEARGCDGKGTETREGCVCGCCTRPCSECHDGKPLHTIQHECGACKGITINRDIHERVYCSTCMGSRIVSLPGLWTYDALLPVLDRPSGPEDDDGPMVYLFGSCWWRWDGKHAHAITVHGTPEPGHFVLAVTRRTS